MKQRLLTTQDIVQTNEKQERFSKQVDISPLNITKNCGLIKDYKQLKNINELLIEFDGLNEVNDNGKGIFKRIDNEILKEDLGVILKIGQHFYKRQYTGKVLLDWFNSDSINTLLLVVKKYKQVKLSNKKYKFNITNSYNIEVTDNFYIDGNQAEIEIISDGKLPYILKLLFNAPIDYALFTNCKLTFNATTFVNATRVVNCKIFDFYTENIFVDKEAHEISLTNGNIINGLPCNIQNVKKFINIPQYNDIRENITEQELLSIKDLDTLSFVVTYVYARNRTNQNVNGQKTFNDISLPLATKPTEYCNMQNLQNIIEQEMEQQLYDYILAKSKEIKLTLSGNFPEGAVYIQIAKDNKGTFNNIESPEYLFGSQDNIPWTDMTAYLAPMFENEVFTLRKNSLRNNDAIYIGQAKLGNFATDQSANQMPSILVDIEHTISKIRNFKIWYKGDVTKLNIIEEGAKNETN